MASTRQIVVELNRWPKKDVKTATFSKTVGDLITKWILETCQRNKTDSVAAAMKKTITDRHIGKLNGVTPGDLKQLASRVLMSAEICSKLDLQRLLLKAEKKVLKTGAPAKRGQLNFRFVLAGFLKCSEIVADQCFLNLVQIFSIMLSVKENILCQIEVVDRGENELQVAGIFSPKDCIVKVFIFVCSLTFKRWIITCSSEWVNIHRMMVHNG